MTSTQPAINGRPSEHHAPPPLLLHASTPTPLRNLLPRLTASLARAGSFIRNQHASSVRGVSLQVEVHRHAGEDLYAALVGSGLDLSRAAHMALASLCTPSLFPQRPGSSSLLHLRLDIHSLELLDDSSRSLVRPTLTASA